MEDAEKRVLRRRKYYLAETLQVSDVLLDMLQMAGILSNKQLKIISSENSNQMKMAKLVDFVCASRVPMTFRIFCQIIQDRHQAASKNLESDLRMEKGQIKVDVDNEREAGLLVHRKFGSSKRVSETEKKGMADLIAKKLQVMRDEFKSESAALELSLGIAKGHTGLGHTIACQLTSHLHLFLREHTMINTHAHDMITPKETLTFGVNNTEQLQKFQFHFKTFLDRLTGLFTYMASIVEEREKCVKLLQINDKKASISDTLENVYGFSASNSKLRGNGSDVERTLQRQRTTIFDLEEQVTLYEAEIQELKKQLKLKISACE